MKKVFILISIFTVSVLNSGTSHGAGKHKAASKQEAPLQCYWMENTSGKFKWIPARDAAVQIEKVGLNVPETKEDCRAMDSCDGGGGASHGGCYKWASSPDGKREAW